MAEKTCDSCEYFHRGEHEHPCSVCIRNNGQLEMWSEEKSDNVNHPSHYCQEGSMECIDEMIAVFGKTAVLHFCLLNVWKYRKRSVFKNGEEDMKKADWYMNKYIELGGKVIKT